MPLIPTKTKTQQKTQVASAYLVGVALITGPIVLGLYSALLATSIANYNSNTNSYNSNTNTYSGNTNTNTNTNSDSTTDSEPIGDATGVAFLRGDANMDGEVDIADVSAISGYLSGNAPEVTEKCLDAADVDDSGSITDADYEVLYNYLFNNPGGVISIAAPYPIAGTDPTADTLSCGCYETETGCGTLTNDDPSRAMFLRGDANCNFVVDLDDAFVVMGKLVPDAPVPVGSFCCDKAADANDDGQVDVGDVESILYYIGEGTPLAPPGPLACGGDPTPDNLTCYTTYCGLASETTQAEPTTTTLYPAEDTYTSPSSVDTSHGSYTYMKVDNSPDYKSYLKFDLSNVSGTVEAATLRLYATNSSNDGGYAYLATNNWNENTLTYNNDAVSISEQAAAIGRVTAGQWVELDVRGSISPGSVNSFAIITSSSDGSAYNTSNSSSNRPELIITYYDNSGSGATAIETETTIEQEKEAVLSPSEDTYISPSTIDTPHGSYSSLKVDNSPDYRSYLKFDFSPYSGEVVSAVLRLYATNSSSDGGAVHIVENAWSEATLTYANSSDIGTLLQAANIGKVSRESWVEIDLTHAVDIGGTQSFMLKTTSGDGSAYNSSNNSSNKPELVLRYR